MFCLEVLPTAPAENPSKNPPSYSVSEPCLEACCQNDPLSRATTKTDQNSDDADLGGVGPIVDGLAQEKMLECPRKDRTLSIHQNRI